MQRHCVSSANAADTLNSALILKAIRHLPNSLSVALPEDQAPNVSNWLKLGRNKESS